jgi:hypothetical protein
MEAAWLLPNILSDGSSFKKQHELSIAFFFTQFK